MILWNRMPVSRPAVRYVKCFVLKFVQSDDAFSWYENIELIFWSALTSLTLACLLTENVSVSAAVCVCVCVCLSVPGSTNQSLGLKRTCQARRLSVATWPVWCSSVRVDVLALLTV